MDFVLDTKYIIQMAKKCNNDAPGMRWCRSRNNDWELRKKRGDTLLGTIEKQYGINLGRRRDMEPWNYLDEKWINSLNDLITGK